MSAENAGPSGANVTANKQGQSLSRAHQQSIYNVFLQHRAEGRNKTESVDLAAAVTGVSARSVWKVVQAKETTGEFKSPSRKRRRKSLYETLTEEQLRAIKKHVHDFSLRNEPPTLRNLEPVINNDKTLPTMSRETLRKALKKLGFKFGK